MADAARPVAMSWIRRHIPTRESIHSYRLLRPFAARLSNPSLWRMTHRSVPRGVALGLGIGVIIPFMHTIIAAILAIPFRANVAVAAAVTLVVNPLTMGPMYIAAYRIGSWEMHHDSDLVDPAAAQRFSSELSRFLFWAHHASGPIGLGILTIAAGAALLGYVATSLAWRWWLGSKWRQRRDARLSRGG
ncbi:DUF2062 domain-containing protein [Sphingomonas sp.]|uniref:DUF2062 domain-containing protein n=1 Tax=Sphingomonas sp. TaxID=28214 RepID=UPI0025D2158D|nr:DUF2062 domain-containing protein [Sphingomonas sp.]MBV9528469.1 DUF2062 domain-containing protein [Sphingomonas sp.]